MNFISSLLGNLNYGTILFLMLLESTVVPVPSEFVVTPAAYHAAGGNLDVFLVILFATIGADLGASINYVVAYYVGRPVIYRFANSKWGKMCLLNQEKVEKSEKYFDDHGMACHPGRTWLVSAQHRTRGSTQRQDHGICRLHQVRHHRIGASRRGLFCPEILS